MKLHLVQDQDNCYKNSNKSSVNVAVCNAQLL